VQFLIQFVFVTIPFKGDFSHSLKYNIKLYKLSIHLVSDFTRFLAQAGKKAMRWEREYRFVLG